MSQPLFNDKDKDTIDTLMWALRRRTTTATNLRDAEAIRSTIRVIEDLKDEYVYLGDLFMEEVR